MSEHSYQQFCPLSIATEILCSRWTMLILREFLAGTSRFNDLRRGLPGISPALLSKRLKELEQAGVIERCPAESQTALHQYRLTISGRELRPIIEAMGVWGHRWTGSEPQLQKLDAGLLMWNMRRKIRVENLPRRRTVIQFIYPEQSEHDRNYWYLIDPGGEPDLCVIDPGFEVDLFVRTDLRTMTAVFMGMESYSKAVDEGRLVLIGDRGVERNMLTWLRLSVYAGMEKRVA